VIGVGAYNADNFSTLLPTTRKSTPISVHVCFSALLPTTPIIFQHCGPQRGKMIGVVAYTAENYRRCCQQRRKMFEFEYLHEFETICEFTIGFQLEA
jgi:hypothetical protein